MKCKICGSKKIDNIYNDYIRNGHVGSLTSEPYKMYQCDNCGVIWHDIKVGQNKEYYETEKYRQELELSAKVDDYFALHDVEVLEKLEYTGTGIYRDKVVMDIGAGGGSFLDFVHSVARETVAIEPSKAYRNAMIERGHRCFAYAKDAIDNGIKADIIASFDVIEHVDDPGEFMQDLYNLLEDDGIGYVGTPTDAPILRTLLGHDYEQFLFSYQHPWILSEVSIKKICQEAGFKDVTIRYVQRYGLSNTLAWLSKKKPEGHIRLEFISQSLEQQYKRSCEELKQADYIISVVRK